MTPGAAAPSLYVHVPFCVVKCGYCDFNSYAISDSAVHDRFLAALDRELGATWTGRAPSSVFVGGGTPTYLSEGRFELLLEILGRHVDLHSCPEVSLEANPESMTPGKARAARSAGIGRISIGAQSFDRDRLRFLDRAHDAAATRRAFTDAREAGFDNISLDLMFGIPGQSTAEWERDLGDALELGPDHLSCYNLTFEEGTRLSRDARRGVVAPNDEGVDRDMFVLTREVLASASFCAYEISNFAGRGGPCRHNDHYWLQGDYAGVGPGAASHRAGIRSTNLKPVEAWARAVESGLPASAEAETLTRPQRAREALWLGLRRTDGVDLAALEARLRVPVGELFAPQIDRFAARGWLAAEGSRIALTGEGLLFADRVGASFLNAG